MSIEHTVSFDQVSEMADVSVMALTNVAIVLIVSMYEKNQERVFRRLLQEGSSDALLL